MDSNLIPYQPVISDIKNLITSGQNVAYNAVNRAMIMTYWNVGKRIVEEEQSGAERAEYGKRLISILSDELTKEFGSNYSGRSLRYYRKFYLCFPDFEIWNTRVPNLNWSHFRALLRVPDEDARVWYMNEAANENWSVRTLDRNIGTQYYYRLLHSPKKEAVMAEMKEKTVTEPKHQFELLKSPIVAEFLGFRTEDSFAESDLESAILSHIRDFLMEMGKGFAFVARQQHIVTDTEDYYIDLVFYNIELKCKEGDNPTIGILLCGETSEDIARYSVLHDNDHLFMSKYLTYLPTKEQLRAEIERQKNIFYMQHPKLDDKR